MPNKNDKLAQIKKAEKVLLKNLSANQKRYQENFYFLLSEFFKLAKKLGVKPSLYIGNKLEVVYK